jgi:hypothetical protein
MSREQHAQFVIGRMNEAVRVAQNVPRLVKPIVNAYIWYRYHDVDEFLSRVRKDKPVVCSLYLMKFSVVAVILQAS